VSIHAICRRDQFALRVGNHYFGFRHRVIREYWSERNRIGWKVVYLPFGWRAFYCHHRSRGGIRAGVWNKYWPGVVLAGVGGGFIAAGIEGVLGGSAIFIPMLVSGLVTLGSGVSWMWTARSWRRRETDAHAADVRRRAELARYMAGVR
jgi:hypothetical protein